MSVPCVCVHLNTTTLEGRFPVAVVNVWPFCTYENMSGFTRIQVFVSAINVYHFLFLGMCDFSGILLLKKVTIVSL